MKAGAIIYRPENTIFIIPLLVAFYLFFTVIG